MRNQWLNDNLVVYVKKMIFLIKQIMNLLYNDFKKIKQKIVKILK